ncbi:MAG: hypothetical protein Tp167SUR398091_31 [Prokaryotic dsDNA virus sp.]|jgi:hypothetical protein|nr:MAG: hypothetical protein Tp167SUR398091_31 [Prokaryotic dsDNA virus sp.]|tara:strand:- start:24713 stop:24913 length:201 start_codon:yes stop_codon:yes gene_type:complete
MESQNKQIKAYLEEGNSITAIQALEKFGCFRLAARIKDLKETGMVIDKAMIANNEGKHHAVYWEVS